MIKLDQFRPHLKEMQMHKEKPESIESRKPTFFWKIDIIMFLKFLKSYSLKDFPEINLFIITKVIIHTAQ